MTHTEEREQAMDVFYLIILWIALIFGFYFITKDQPTINDRCSQQFGTSWYGVSDGWGGGFCTNQNGEQRFPKE